MGGDREERGRKVRPEHVSASWSHNFSFSVLSGNKTFSLFSQKVFEESYVRIEIARQFFRALATVDV